jgi:hypothetical protein
MRLANGFLAQNGYFLIARQGSAMALSHVINGETARKNALLPTVRKYT